MTNTPSGQAANPSETAVTPGHGDGHRDQDPSRLRIAASELFALMADLDQLAETLAERPEQAMERAAGVQAAKAILLARVVAARRQLTHHTSTPPAPAVLDPTTLPAQHSTQGQHLNPVISRPAVATDGISSTEVWMPPGHAARAHVHHDTDVIVLVRDGRAITIWWDHHGQPHELPHHPGQHLHIPRGVPHAAINPGNRPIIATEFRSNSHFDADNHLLPDLDHTVTAECVSRLLTTEPMASPGAACLELAWQHRADLGL